jgi:hypothetical protein
MGLMSLGGIRPDPFFFAGGCIYTNYFSGFSFIRGSVKEYFIIPN